MIRQRSRDCGDVPGRTSTSHIKRAQRRLQVESIEYATEMSKSPYHRPADLDFSPVFGYAKLSEITLPIAFPRIVFDPDEGVGDMRGHWRFNGLSPSLVAAFMCLPTEIRYKIYELVTFSRSRAIVIPEGLFARDWWAKDFQLRILRRPRHMQLIQNPPYEERKIRDELITAEYDNTFAMLETSRRCNWPSFGDDFKHWLWDSVVLHLEFEFGSLQSINMPYTARIWPSLHQELHASILHVSLDLDTIAIPHASLRYSEDCETGYKSMAYHRSCYKLEPCDIDCSMGEFVFRCNFIAAHLPNLYSLTLHILLQPHQMKYVLKFPRRQAWIRAVNRIPLKESIIVNIDVAPQSRKHSRSYKSGRFDSLIEAVRRCLGEWMVPMSLRIGEDESYELGRLFAVHD